MVERDLSVPGCRATFTPAARVGVSGGGQFPPVNSRPGWLAWSRSNPTAIARPVRTGCGRGRPEGVNRQGVGWGRDWRVSMTRMGRCMGDKGNKKRTQGTDLTINQPRNRAAYQPTHKQTKKTNNNKNSQPTKQPPNQQTNLPTNKPTNQPKNK